MGLTHNIPGVLDPVPGGKHLVDAVDFVINWARSNSLWPLTYGTSCCAIEMMSASMPRYDISRFGSEVFRASPRQADLILLAGTITEKMAGPLQTLYEQMPGPKYVIAMGACTIAGGPFYYDNYSVVKGADRIIPVDVFIPGCPPRPEALFHGLLTLQEMIKKESIRNPWKPRDLYKVTAEDRWSKAAAAWAELEKLKDQEMAEVRAKFKEENPEYVAFKAVRMTPEANADLKREPGKGVGLPNAEIWDVVTSKFPAVGLHRIEAPDRAKVEALPADTPLDFVIPADQYVAFANFLRSDGRLNMDLLLDVTAIDWTTHFDVVVHLLNVEHGHKIFFRTPLAKAEVPADVTAAVKANTLLASIPTLSALWPAANWKEREVYDMFGIDFAGHPDLRRLFLQDDFPGYPLRKDFQHPNMVKRPY